MSSPKEQALLRFDARRVLCYRAYPFTLPAFRHVEGYNSDTLLFCIKCAFYLERVGIALHLPIDVERPEEDASPACSTINLSLVYKNNTMFLKFCPLLLT